MAEGEIDNLTTEQYLALTRGNQAPGVVKPEIGGNVNFEIKSQFMRELREDTFSRNKNDDAHEHVERVLDIVSLFNILGVSHDAVMLRVFPITLTRAAKRWVDRLPPGTVDSWDLLKKAFIQSHQKVNIFYNGLGTMNRQLLDSQGPIPGMTPAQALTAIQTMADHSQKWHDGTSNRNIEGSSNSEGIAAIVRKLDNLCRDMKKLKENVHAIQVGCQNCGGAHLDKDCPLNEEVKSVEEAKYGEPSLEELMNKHLEESTRRRAEIEEWVKKLQENVKINTRNQSASLKNLKTQIEQLTKEFHTKAANEINNSSFDHCKAVYTDKKTPHDNGQHEASFDNCT
ncbi:hypothetical protein Tco_0865586 [Tanacetum coccineum]